MYNIFFALFDICKNLLKVIAILCMFAGICMLLHVLLSIIMFIMYLPFVLIIATISTAYNILMQLITKLLKQIGILILKSLKTTMKLNISPKVKEIITS